MPNKGQPALPIAIIGTGTMGAMIGLSLARAELSVRLWSNDAGSIGRAKVAIAASLDIMERKGIIDAAKRQNVLDHIEWPVSMADAVSGVGIVIEAVPEKREIKRAIFSELEQLIDPHTAVWSNTSSLNVFALAPPGLQDRLLVAHWFHPAQILPLVEVIRGPQTSEDAVSAAMEMLRSVGKSPVLIKSYVAGFVINRLLRALGREAFHLIDNDYISVEDLDLAVKTSIAPRMQLLGVMQRYDFTDLRISAANLANPDFIDAPVDTRPASLIAHIDREEFGVKSGRGFYDYGDATEAEILTRFEGDLWDVMLGPACNGDISAETDK